LLLVEGLGPKRIRVLCEELKITGIEDLRKAAGDGKLEEIRGFGPKIVQKILAEAKNLNGESRTKLIVAEEIANSLVDWLKKTTGVGRIEIAGSLRRRKETVGDLDILATCENSDEVMNRFVKSAGALRTNSILSAC
jgi:DNA polymerase (family X)